MEASNRHDNVDCFSSPTAQEAQLVDLALCTAADVMKDLVAIAKAQSNVNRDYKVAP